MYHIYFKWMDPIISIVTAHVMLFHPDLVLASFNPQLVPRDPKYDVLLWFCSGVFSMISVYHALLLRYTDDVGVWKITNLGVVVLDFMILGAMVEMHFASRESSAAAFRPDDYMNYFLTLLAIVMRLSFIENVGLRTESVTKQKKGQ